MAHRSEPRFLVLHRLRVRGLSEPDTVALGTGLDVAEAEGQLRTLDRDGLVSRRDGKVLSGWSLTPDGRMEHARLLGEELNASGAKPIVDAGYQRFLAINVDLRAVCIDWASSDHTDPTADLEMVERLASLDAQALPITKDLSAHLQRFGPYQMRLGAALKKVRAGEAEWFAKPLIDSYHTVWFELHEDLMATLGIQRGEDT